MNLETQYLGLKLAHPLMPGASPMVQDLDMVKKLEDAGAAAIVMQSLFEEQIVAEQINMHTSMDTHNDYYAEATSFFPNPLPFNLGSDEYLERLRRIKQAVAVPVIGSLNGTSPGGWLKYARLMEQAGADALELNVYELPTDPDMSAADVEKDTIEMVEFVARTVKIPVAVKLSPFYSSPVNLAKKLIAVGAAGLVLFNRFYQPDIDIEEFEVLPFVKLSNSEELLLRLRWLAIVSGQTDYDLAVTGGVHNEEDAIKAVMCGAHVVQMVSALLTYGPDYIKQVHDRMIHWMEEHDYQSIRQMRGSMNLASCPNPKAYERANYMQILQSWEY